MLKIQCLQLAKFLQGLQELARIDVDLLGLSVDLEHVPQAKEELDKVQRLVNALFSMEEIDVTIKALEQDLCMAESERSDYDESSADRKKSPNQLKCLGDVLSELICYYSGEEILDTVDEILEQSLSYDHLGKSHTSSLDKVRNNPSFSHRQCRKRSRYLSSREEELSGQFQKSATDVEGHHALHNNNTNLKLRILENSVVSLRSQESIDGNGSSDLFGKKLQGASGPTWNEEMPMLNDNFNQSSCDVDMFNESDDDKQSEPPTVVIDMASDPGAVKMDLQSQFPPRNKEIESVDLPLLTPRNKEVDAVDQSLVPSRSAVVAPLPNIITGLTETASSSSSKEMLAQSGDKLNTLIQASDINGQQPNEYSTSESEYKAGRVNMELWNVCSMINSHNVKMMMAGDPKTGIRTNDRKPDYCLYCEDEYMSNITEHYTSVHSEESKVKNVIDLPLESNDRWRQWILLKNEGNNAHNMDVLRRGYGKITVEKRPCHKDGTRAENYLPCVSCKAWIFEKDLSVHSRKCLALVENQEMFSSESTTCTLEKVPMAGLEVKQENEDDVEGKGEEFNETIECKKSPMKSRKMGLNLRRRWNAFEEKAIVMAFGQNIYLKSNPTSDQVRKAQEQHPCLKDRSVAVVKSKLNNIILGKCHNYTIDESYIDQKQTQKISVKGSNEEFNEDAENNVPNLIEPSKTRLTVRKRWNMFEEKAVVMAFRENIYLKTNPTADQVRRAREQYPCLQDRSVAIIKSKISNIILGKTRVRLLLE